MFIKTIIKTDKKSGKQYKYYRLCESYRIGNQPRHRTVVSMGKLEGIESKEDKKTLADLIEHLTKGENQLPLFEQKPDIEKYAKEFAARILEEKLIDVKPPAPAPVNLPPVEKDYETIDVNSLKHEQVREIGAEWLCRQALGQLGLEGFLTTKCGFSQTAANISMVHLVSRAVYPASEHKTAQWIKENSAVAGLFDIPLYQVNRFKLYTASNNLYAQKAPLEKHLSVKTGELFDLQDKIVFYDLTNTYFEGRKAGSKIAKFGRSKEKRSDARIVAMAAVINAEGFLKYSRIYQGNISDSATLEKTVEELAANTSSTSRKPVVVMGAGIMTEENSLMLKAKGYDYIGVSRTKLKDYPAIAPDGQNTKIYDKKGNPIELRLVTKPGDTDTYMYVRSEQKAIDVTWTRNPLNPKSAEGIYFIRTSLPHQEEQTLWTIYNTLTEIEATFRVLKTDLALRPVFHKYDENIESHLFLGLLAYQIVATLRYQLKQKGITHDWRNIVRIMNTQKEVTTTLKNKKGKTIMLKKCSTPTVEAKKIYDALGYKHNPYFLKKSVVPE